jgi:O-methyltransferase
MSIKLNKTHKNLRTHFFNKIDALKKRYPIQLIKNALLLHGESFVSYNDQERLQILELINEIRKKTELIMTDTEACQIYMTTKLTKKSNGDVAEVGVYKGASAKLICEAKGERSLYLFDTFEGLPKVDKKYDSQFYKGKFASQLTEVKQLLKGYKNVFIFKGLFPDTAEPIKNKVFSFVNLDVDTYSSTKACLDFFYPRMNKGGMIISHDYYYAVGVRKAVDEFFSNKEEVVLGLAGTQCLIVKL